MKKFFLLASLVLFSLSISASDELISVTQSNDNQSSALLARRTRGGSIKGWYTCIGRCNVRYAPSTSADIAFTLDDGEPVWVVGRVGNWYKIHHGSSDDTIYYTHVQNLRRYYGPVTWG